MKMADVFPSNYLAAADFEEDTVRTIARVEEEVLGRGKDAQKKAVIYFEEEDKGLICNKTNFKTIAGLHGDDTDDWTGKQITLYATEVPFGDEMVMSVRVRLKAPKAAGKGKPSPSGAPEAPAASAPVGSPNAERARAWKAFLDVTPNLDDDARKSQWAAGLKYVFPMKNDRELTGEDWRAVAFEFQTNYSEEIGGFVPV